MPLPRHLSRSFFFGVRALPSFTAGAWLNGFGKLNREADPSNENK